MKKFTRSQKCYFAALGVGLCALLLDQAFGGAPPSLPSHTAAAALPDRTPDAPPPPVLTDPTTSVFDRRLAQRLTTLNEQIHTTGGPRDGFAPAAAWRPDANNAPGERALKFRQNHVLRAVVSDRQHPQAMLDHQLVAVGQAVDGFTLIAVGPMRAVFSDGQDRIELTLGGVPRPPVP